MVAFHKVTGGNAAEIREINAHDFVVVTVKDLAQAQLGLGPLGALFQVPLSFLTPAEPDRPVGCHDLAAGFVIGDSFPVGVVGFAQLSVEILCAQHATGDEVTVAVLKPDEHRHVGVFAGIVFEVLGLPVQMEFAQDHMAHGHRQCGIRPGLRIQPQSNPG